jgi:hypothetical protein
MKARVDVWRAPIGWSGLNVGYMRTHGASFLNVSGICDTKVRMGVLGRGRPVDAATGQIWISSRLYL